MNRFHLSAFRGAIALFTACMLAGCGQAPSKEAPVATKTSGNQSPSTDAVTKAAANFLDAVLKGDTQRASACLTPQAMQRINASGKPFSPPGLENASFRIGEVRSPAVDKAFVHCVVTDSSSGQPQSEDMCCLMRLVDNDWRVSGIAYWGPNQSGTMSDFETGQSTPIPRLPSSPNTAGPTTNPTPPVSGTLPARVAQEPSTTNAY